MGSSSPSSVSILFLELCLPSGETKMAAMENLRQGNCGSSFIKDVLSQHPGLFGNLLANASRFRFQLLLSVPVSAPEGSLRLVRHGYRVDDEYFYPASAIKLCAAVAAIQKLERLQSFLGVNFNCNTSVALHSLFEGTEDDRSDPSNVNRNQITVAHEIRKIFLVSDNQAFNRLFSFVGHRTINQAMWDLGLQSTRLHHRLSVLMSAAENHYSEPIGVEISGSVFSLPPKKSGLGVQDSSGLPGIEVGTAYIADDDRLVPQPMDFSMKNCISMMDLQDLLIKLVRPDIELDTPGLKLDTSMRMLLMEAMAQYPSQSANPKYDGSDYPDDYCKFFLPGLSRVRPKSALRIYNKIGRAYGFTIDNSYVFDVETGQSFFMTAVMYTNANGVLNDDRYEYEFADSTLADVAEVLGRVLWQIPDSSATSSSPFDCTPSSLWTVCTKSLVIPTFCQSNVDAEEVEGSKLLAKDKSNAVEQNLTEMTIPLISESLSLCQFQVDEDSQHTSLSTGGPESGSSCGILMKQSNLLCSSISQPNAVKPVQINSTALSTAEGPHCNLSGNTMPTPSSQGSSFKVVATPSFSKTAKNSMKPCYKYFVDE